ncbi:hypothetical protein NXY32_03535 [Bacteroides fragilis]|nr:hypothetical protein [Bacteroides fragilis]
MNNPIFLFLFYLVVRGTQRVVGNIAWFARRTLVIGLAAKISNLNGRYKASFVLKQTVPSV